MAEEAEVGGVALGENDEVGLQVGRGEAGGLGLEGFGAGGEANGEAGLDRGDAHGGDAWVGWWVVAV